MSNGVDRSVIKPTFTEGVHISAETLTAAALKSPAIGVMRTCITCMKFIENTEHCSQFGAQPPARVIAYGCPQYENDDIPF